MSQFLNFSALQSISFVPSACQVLIRQDNTLSGAFGFARSSADNFVKSSLLFTTVNTNSAAWTSSYTSLSAYTPIVYTPTTLTFASSLTPNAQNGLYRKILMTGNTTLFAPTNGQDGMKWKARFTADGSNRTLTINSAIIVPSLSQYTGSTVISANKMWIVQLEYNGTAWILETLIGGY